MTNWGLGIGIAMGVLAAVTLWCLQRVRREYGGVRTPASAFGVWVIYVLHLAIVVVASVRMVWPVPVPWWPVVGLGIPILAAGVALATSGMCTFGSVRRMFGRDTSRLITSGIYAWSRNPQNVGWILAQFGIALLGRSGLALLMSTLFAAIFFVYVRYEERHLEAVFGQEYRTYRQRSHRFVGLPFEFTRRKSNREAGHSTSS